MTRGAGGIQSKWNVPRKLLLLVIAHSPSNTWIITCGRLSTYVVHVCAFFEGIVVLRSISFVIKPLAVSKSKNDGLTNNNTLLRMAACTTATEATASSELMDLLCSFPFKTPFRPSSARWECAWNDQRRRHHAHCASRCRWTEISVQTLGFTRSMLEQRDDVSSVKCHCKYAKDIKSAKTRRNAKPDDCTNPFEIHNHLSTTDQGN